MLGGGVAFGHDYGEVGLAHSEDVVDAVAGHGNGFADGFEFLDDKTFLVWADAAEDGGARNYAAQGFVVHVSDVNVVVEVSKASTLGDFGDG